MASLLFFALYLSISGLVLSDSLVAFANENPTNYLIYLAVYTFLYLLVPSEFISAIILLLLKVAVPKLSFLIKYLTMVTQVFVVGTLLVGVPLMVHVTFAEAVMPDSLKITLIGVAAMATMYKYNPLRRYFCSIGQTVSSFVPAFATLCILTGTFLSFSYQNNGNPLIPVSTQLFLLCLNYFNFLLAVLLLFLSIGVPTNGPQTSIPAGLVELLVKAILAMSFTTAGLIGFYTVDTPVVRFI